MEKNRSIACGWQHNHLLLLQQLLWQRQRQRGEEDRHKKELLFRISMQWSHFLVLVLDDRIWMIMNKRDLINKLSIGIVRSQIWRDSIQMDREDRRILRGIVIGECLLRCLVRRSFLVDIKQREVCQPNVGLPVYFILDWC
jgi:hypothetical protein